MAYIFGPENNPKEDKQGFFDYCQSLGMQDLSFRAYNAAVEPLPAPIVGNVPNISGVVIACSGNRSIIGPESSIKPAEDSPIYFIKLIRDDQKDGHVNVDLRVCFQDAQGRKWCNREEYVPDEEHVQKFFNGTDFGDIERYTGFPTVKSGLIVDYSSQLGSLPFYKAGPKE